MKSQKSQFDKSMNIVDVLFLAIGAMLGWGWVVLSVNGYQQQVS